MLKERQKEKEETEERRKSEKIETDEELWARLEELEVSIKRQTWYIRLSMDGRAGGDCGQDSH